MTARQASWRLALLLLIVGVGVVVAVTVGLPSVTQLREGFARFGPWAAVVFVLGYAVGSLSPLPKSLFTLAAGAVFGVAVGVLVVMAGATLGALVALYLARLLGREGVHRLTGVRADRFDARLERHGMLAVLVARLVPVVPFTAVNYLAGLTGLGVRVFVVGTVLGILPATTMYAVLGAYGRSRARCRSRSPWPVWSPSRWPPASAAPGVGAGPVECPHHRRRLRHEVALPPPRGRRRRRSQRSRRRVQRGQGRAPGVCARGA